ncbi:Oidioi.mRNA.OKI2018_I69.chr1.g3152.t1.cds [Oikopleura dioica]|uniref:Oidioi.mRNA.OKI2018_I69.chr1.g3152.t1.cds n=1 Tax=Oikopleura dioica TaxID=34765 RepID=A0ABN7SZS0_OIKDI|nr:Oidioi.mRNA.OKI2018_I69.chr1.g3152.t1.cds [Oikopleura dioica]
MLSRLARPVARTAVRFGSSENKFAITKEMKISMGASVFFGAAFYNFIRGNINPGTNPVNYVPKSAL